MLKGPGSLSGNPGQFFLGSGKQDASQLLPGMDRKARATYSRSSARLIS